MTLSLPEFLTLIEGATSENSVVDKNQALFVLITTKTYIRFKAYLVWPNARDV